MGHWINSILAGDSEYKDANNREQSSVTEKIDLQKYYYTNSIVDVWNRLPKYVVQNDTVNISTRWLDKFRQDQEVILNFR